MEIENVQLRALIIEDVENDALLLLNELRREGYKMISAQVETPEALIQEMESHNWDIIFCDYSMPKMNGRQALSIVRELNPDIPFIFVSGSIGEDIAVDAMRNGAQDYIMKDNLKRLAPAVRRELVDAKRRQEKHLAEQQLHFLTYFDQLTHLPNRIQFVSQLKQQFGEQSESQNAIAVISVNLDRFKNINDSLGYEAGDLLLQAAANRLSECVGNNGIVARFAADEFFIMLPKAHSPQVVDSLVINVLDTMGEPFNILGFKLYLNASLGIALYPQDAKNAESLIRNADIATCRTKSKGGKGASRYTTDMTVKLEELIIMEQAMRDALLKEEFELYYQPQMALKNRCIIGMESLVRWNRPGFGIVSPDQFIPLAEETGLIIGLGEWVLRQACVQACRWRDAGLQPFRIAVNISPLQFHHKDLAGQIIRLLQEYKLQSLWLEIEITENVIMQDRNAALVTLQKLQEYGVSVALDDFGTGYSSLSYLKYFKVNNLKIDRAFIKDIPHDKDDAAITSAVIAMAKKLNINVVAEGVEDKQQLDFLLKEGCDYIQGYYLGRPMNVSKLERWMNEYWVNDKNTLN